MQSVASLQGYERLRGGAAPVVHAPGMADLAREVWCLLETGAWEVSDLLGEPVPRLEALLVADGDWREAPRESRSPYPPGLPYFTRATEPPALVLPETLSPAIRPRTGATYPLVVWHELAHAFLLQREAARTPAWLRELVPQALSAAVARRTGLPLEEHLSEVDRNPGFTVRGLKGHASAEEQMVFQNLLLLLGDGALAEFGGAFLNRLVHGLWGEADVVDEARAEELLAGALGPGGREWLVSRPEF